MPKDVEVVSLGAHQFGSGGKQRKQEGETFFVTGPQSRLLEAIGKVRRITERNSRRVEQVKAQREVEREQSTKRGRKTTSEESMPKRKAASGYKNREMKAESRAKAAPAKGTKRQYKRRDMRAKG